MSESPAKLPAGFHALILSINVFNKARCQALQGGPRKFYV